MQYRFWIGSWNVSGKTDEMSIIAMVYSVVNINVWRDGYDKNVICIYLKATMKPSTL